MAVPTGYVHGAKAGARTARIEARQDFTPTPGGIAIERGEVVTAESDGGYDVDIIGDDGQVRGTVSHVLPLAPATLAIGDSVLVAWLADDDQPRILVSGGGGGGTDLGVLMD